MNTLKIFDLKIQISIYPHVWSVHENLILINIFIIVKDYNETIIMNLHMETYFVSR